ncbi:GMC family oxidoreductase N-terminal domain-containing protein [Natronosporangium hydrolyticum]|uniref:GMC family oxidoreductase N-terminal domain-containing protein n=1 Tax=Natronosporangium hydrolyticum TaxID=2811111 RepID=A0A895Y9I0_9ACTN|nr:GMC oxidoreductase [Natronosporangium hydrolyticum]QSB13981.1 GMC family oxidoreductase N-terminal domain-containing protein [Natronosporangium hydrolyticum]
MTGTTEWECVVVGAGSAGSVLASRLAAAGQRVLLLEAGPAQPNPASASHPLRDAGRLVLRDYNWDHQVNLRGSGRHAALLAGSGPVEGSPARARWARFPYQLGKVVGGSSAVNGAVAMRALPRDFDQWVKRGNPDWSADRVLPYYRRLEDDRDFGDDPQRHGAGGPVPITRARRSELHELDAAFWRACTDSGLPALPDLNHFSGAGVHSRSDVEAGPGGGEAGVGPVPTNAVDGVRMDTATCYLPVPPPPNLTIHSGALVTRVLTAGGRAVGVELRDGRTVYAGEVVLSAGAIGTPALLQRSGIGDARLCRALGISPVADLPGVGEQLTDHASIVIWAVPASGDPRPRSRWREVAARLTSGVDGEVDLQLGLLNDVDTAAIPDLAGRFDTATAVGMSVMLMRPESRGRVFLTHPDPDQPPAVELGMGGHEQDLARLAGGVRAAWRLLRSPAIADRLARIQFWSDRMIDDDVVVRSAVRNIMNPGWHPTSTAQMGPATDPTSVVDQECRVHGVPGLRVVDASVFPTIPSVPTNLTTIMLAERIASRLEG